MARRGAVPTRQAPAGWSQGHRPYRLAWGCYTVVVEWVILDPDSPPENYRQLRIVDTRSRSARTFREFRIFDVHVVRLLGDRTGELWFQASAGGNNGLGMCGAYTQAGGLHNILFARDVLSATPVVKSSPALRPAARGILRSHRETPPIPRRTRRPRMTGCRMTG